MAELKLDGEAKAFPWVPRVVYERNPLQRVTCCLKFPPILEIKTKAPADFQSRIRAEYPCYQELNPSPSDWQVEVSTEVSNLLKKLLPEAGPEHKFACEEQERVVLLSESSLVFEDSAYERREKFWAELRRLEEEFAEVYRPARYTGVNLRYLNLIDPRGLALESSDWGRWIETTLLGLLASKERSISGLIQQTRNQVEFSFGHLVSHTEAHCLLRHGLLEIEETGEDSTTSRAYVIEMDFQAKLPPKPRKGESLNVFAIIEAFSEQARRLFRACITDELHQALIPSEIQG